MVDFPRGPHFFPKNALGKVTRATDPLGRATTFTYAANGIDLLETRQVNGQNTDLIASYSYNSQHQPLTVTDASGQTTTTTYNSAGQVLTVTTPPRAGITENRTTTYVYDTNGYLQTVTGPATGATTTYTYDGYGRIRTETDADGYTLTYDYDALDRMTKTTYPDGTFEETVYNRLDAEKRRDRLARWSHRFYDALRRVTATRDAAGRTTTFQWCTCGSLDKVIDANNNATTWERDLQARVTREIRADSKDYLLSYETTTSRLKQVQDFMSPRQVKTYEYFLDDNLKQVTYTNAVHTTPNVSFTYDAVYNRLATMADGTGTTTYSYNPIAAPPTLGSGEVAGIDGPLTSDTVSYTYDELGRIVTRGLAGAVSTFAFDALGRIASLTHPVGAFTYGYVGTTNRISGVTYPNGQTTARTYFGNSGDNRLQQMKHATSSSAVLSQFDYTYDAVGSIKTWQQQLGANPAKLYTLGYDAVDELTSGVVSGPSPLPVPSRFGYAYDKAGNRTAEQLDDAVMGATYNNWNQVTSRQPGGALLFRGSVNEPATVTVGGKPVQVGADNSFAGPAQVPSGTSNVVVTATDPSGNLRTNTYQVSQSGSTLNYTYDADGNLTGDGTRALEYDAENRLTRVLNGGSEVARFVYDGQGRRVQKIAGGVTTTFVYDMDDVVEERSSTGAVLKYVHAAGSDQHLAMQDGAGNVSYYLADHLGSVVQMSNTSQQVTLSREYDPYGNLLVGGTQGGYAFTGREWDPETGLYSYRARYYDPKLGAFTGEDPVDFRDGLSRYGYVLGQPTTLVDPSGMMSCGKNCPPDVKQGKSDACKYAPTIWDARIRRCVKQKCADPNTTITCLDPSTFPCTVPNYPAWTPSANSVQLCPNNPPPPHTCWKRIIVHELALHACRPGGPGFPNSSGGRLDHMTLSYYVMRQVKCP